MKHSRQKIWKNGLASVSLGHKNGKPVYCFTRSLTNAILNGEWNDKAYRELCQILKYIKDETVCYERLWEKRFGGETENDKIRRSVIFLLGGSRSTSTAFRASGKGVPSISVDGDAGIVRAFAEYQSCWHDNAVSYIRQFGAKFHSKGREARVYLSKDESFVYKIKNDVSHDLLRFFDEIINHNILFPATEYVILGFGLDEHGRFCTILKQDAVKGRPATPKEIEKHFLNLGFEKISDTAYKFGDYIVSDLKPSNVVYSKGKCFVIDCFAQNTFDFDNNFYISTPRPVNSAEISFPHLSGASVISDTDRHPYLVQLCDIITKRGGKYMDEAIETAKIEYNKKYQFFYPKGSMPIFFVYSVLDTEKWIAIERLYREIVETFNETKHLIVNNIRNNAERAALADVLYRILKDRLFWDEIMILKQNPDALSGIKSTAKTIAKNVKNAFKNLSLPEITNNSGYETDDIPETLADRKAMLERMLVPLIGTKKYCTGLRDFAEITGGSVPEICYHASKNKASTLAALCLLDVIAAAKYIPPPTPPHGSTQAKRHISEMYELRCKIKGLGVVKLTIGKRAYNSDMVYCITKFRFDKITKK